MTDFWNPGFVAGSKVALWTAPANTPKPTETTLPAPYSILPSPWTSPGGTVEGVKFAFDSEIKEWTIEEQTTPVKRTKTRKFSVTADLAESTLPNLKLTLGGGTLSTVVGSGSVPTRTSVRLTENFDTVAILLDGIGVNGAILRAYVPVMDTDGKLEVENRATETYRKFSLNLAALCPPDQIEVYELSAAA